MLKKDTVKYDDPTPFDGSCLQSMDIIINGLRHKMFGKDVREPMAQGFEWLTKLIQETGGNQTAEVQAARGTFDLLGQRLTADENAIKESSEKNVKYLAEITAIPETFTTVENLKAKYPDGKNGLFVTADNGHKYIWNGKEWHDSGDYQATGITDESVTNAKLANKSVSRDKLDFQTPEFTNLFSLSDYVADEYYDLNGTLLKKGESGYLLLFGRTTLIPISNGKVIYRNEKAGSSDLSAVYITFFADSTGQNLISSQNFGLGSIPVPEGAAYFSMAVHERAKSQVIITIDQPLKYIDPSLNIDFANLSRIPYTNDQARLVPKNYVSDYLTIDYVNKQVIIKKEPGLAMWGSNLKWIHGPANTSAETDLIYTFAEIRTMTGTEYQYLFVKRVSAFTDADRDIFMFTSQNQFMDLLGTEKGSRNSIAANYVFIGFFRTDSISYSFPGTPLKVITNQTVSPAKNISILGDSISTFSGYIPSGNAAFYPNTFINNVDQTWWKYVINKNSLSLLLNNSWSGSRVTNTRTEEQAGYYRALHMSKDSISPDILIIYLGINDFNNNVKLGDYENDLDTDFPTDGSTFKNAYAMMLDNATKTYPDCKIFTCTLPFSDSQKTGKVVHRNGNNDTLWDFNNAIRDISNQFGTTIIDLAQTGFNRNNAAQVLGDGVLHPNETGMQLLAKKVNFYLQETLADI
ncbi:SGNH/GDSL hydrolase family protein [Loigolactobacillus coryniformis]|uniref:SGNH/GDSL hydrolase family protein n=1 Tax=Loigolactobacillus coryniformis TaxID=1610 RepID=UPI00201A98E2|nr:SGNH/GDSL hydrolase family protein [Loigolactobacillus coryniformis]